VLSVVILLEQAPRHLVTMAPTFKNPFGNGAAEKDFNDGDLSSSPDRAERGGLRSGRRMTRIDVPRTQSISGTTVGSDDEIYDGEDAIKKQLELESSNEIQYRTCSWQKTAALLFSEYICLAIMSFPYSYSVLGLVPGLIFTVFVAAMVLYTSLIVWYAVPHLIF
jgi:hypothetical protein